MKSAIRPLAILGVNFALLGVGIAIVELAFGGWLKPAPLTRLLIPKAVTLQYDVSKLYPASNPVITYSRDPYGLRGRHACPAEVNLLTVGGSTTDQRMLRDGETW